MEESSHVAVWVTDEIEGEMCALRHASLGRGNGVNPDRCRERFTFREKPSLQAHCLS